MKDILKISLNAHEKMAQTAQSIDNDLLICYRKNSKSLISFRQLRSLSPKIYGREMLRRYGAGTAGLNVPMFIALRRFTLLCTIVLERVLLHKSHDRSTWAAVGIMIGGGAPFPPPDPTLPSFNSNLLPKATMFLISQIYNGRAH